jgi:hypothetical protein
MSKNPRFPRRVDCWMSEQFADAIEAIAEARALTTSTVVREGMAFYLKQIGALPQQPRPQT